MSVDEDHDCASCKTCAKWRDMRPGCHDGQCCQVIGISALWERAATEASGVVRSLAREQRPQR